MSTKDFQVIKASGFPEFFDEEKLRRSLRRAGAEEAVIDQVLLELAGRWHQGIRTKAIFKQAFKLLRRLQRPAAARYALKQSMFDFGTSGFPFEDYFAEVLKSRGYQTQTRQLLSGFCIRHEVDVVAKNSTTLLWVECKYHPLAGSVSDVKVPLYIHSRFRDLERQQANNPNAQKDLHVEGWIVTNSRFSDDAITYGRCVGLHLIGWNYPAQGSLRQLVDEAKLYPVTCLTVLSRQEKIRLLESGIVLGKMLKKLGAWCDLLHLSVERRNKVLEEAIALCGEED